MEQINKTKLEIGCGRVADKQPDTLYLDIEAFPGVDIIRDMERGLPFDDDKFEFVKAHHVLEHINDLVFVMNEIHRVLKPGGTVDIEVPYKKNIYKDPTHIRFFEPDSMHFFYNIDMNSINSGISGFFTLIDYKNLEDYALRWVLRK